MPSIKKIHIKKSVKKSFYIKAHLSHGNWTSDKKEMECSKISWTVYD